MTRLKVMMMLCGALVALGCDSEPARDRCARCGMYTDLDVAFAARQGDTAYDTPKCLWKDLLEGKGQAKQAQVTEYYSQKAIRADQALYVLGSDVLGPMGKDLIPVASRESAERFASEHGGHVLRANEIDAGLLNAL